MAGNLAVMTFRHRPRGGSAHIWCADSDAPAREHNGSAPGYNSRFIVKGTLRRFFHPIRALAGVIFHKSLK
jgi:hypothetical protein